MQKMLSFQKEQSPANATNSSWVVFLFLAGNYACVNKSMLNSHMKSHTNVYQYRCADCTYATKYCHSLKLHLKKYNHKPATVCVISSRKARHKSGGKMFGPRESGGLMESCMCHCHYGRGTPAPNLLQARPPLDWDPPPGWYLGPDPLRGWTPPHLHGTPHDQ